MTAPNEEHLVKYLDAEMLAIMGGRERTEAEYGNLLLAAGLRLTRVVPVQGPFQIIEAAPA